MTSLINHTEADDRPAETKADRTAFLARCSARLAAKQACSNAWGPEFDGPLPTKTVTPVKASSYQVAQAILEAAVVAAIKTPLQVILASGMASHTFKPAGDKVKVISRGVENWGTRILAVGEARLLYRKLVNAGFLVW
jgi:hypothetical protein